MGNQLTCGPSSADLNSTVKNSHIRKATTRKDEKVLEQAELLQQQQALVFLLQQQQMGKIMRLDPSAISERKRNPRSGGSSVRSSEASSDAATSNAKSVYKTWKNHFVLIHGGGTGAWCWYKCIAFLEEANFVVTAIDLLGSGIDSTNPNTIKELAQYTKPLLQFLDKLVDGEMVILVGHDLGGACISYAMEQFPHKIAKAIFVAATMVVSGQSAFDVFASEVMYADSLLPQFLYENGNSTSPTAIKFEWPLLEDVFFNQCPSKDVALATVAMRPIPFAPLSEKLNLTDKKYGSIRRFFVETTEDLALSPALQKRLIFKNPPERVFKLKSDHCPFFSKPQSLCKIFTKIAN